MKVNIISLNNAHSLSKDSELLAFCLKKFYKKLKIVYNYYNFQDNKGSQADINIFVGVISNVFFKYAPINILIIDQHKYDINWIPYLQRLDYILTKTELAKSMLEQHFDKNKIINIGWKNVNRFDNSVEKSNNSFLFVCGQSSYRQLESVLSLWNDDYPKLTILSGKNYLKNMKIEKKEQDNIEYIEKYLNENEYTKLLNKHLVHISISSASSFSNTLHDCLSSRGVPITIDSFPSRDFVTNNVTGYIVKTKKKKKIKTSFGSNYIIDESDLKTIIEKVIKIQKEDEILLEEMGEKNKVIIRDSENEFEKNLKSFFDKMIDIYKNNKKNKISHKFEMYNEDLPNVSIITPTYNRSKMLKLARRNFDKTDYPRNKLEWIIVDDSDEKDYNVPEEYIKGDNIKYIRLNERKSIGEKRNIAVENSSYDYIMCMDDDDYYHPVSVKFRLGNLLHLNKNVVGSTCLGVLEINKIISRVSMSSFTEIFHKRVFESTLGFRKEYWKNNKFSDTNCHEGEGLLKNSINDFDDIVWQNIGVSLIHYKNTNKRVIVTGETNGSHFNFDDELFNLITNIDKDIDNENNELNKIIEKETEHSTESSTETSTESSEAK